MKLTTLGSGTFFVDEKISASAFVLEFDKTKILFDCGPGTLIKLAQAGFKLEDLDYVFISHFHPDHTSDLFPLFMNFRLNDIFEPGKIKKFPVFCGPEGLDKFMLDYSRITELHAYESWDKIKIIEYKPVNKFDGFTVKALKVDHAPFDFQGHSYSLRFEIGDKVISFSGDCSLCPGVEKACKNTDLFVCDCSMPKGTNGNIHMMTNEIGELSHRMKVKKLLIDHFYPSYADRDLVGEIKEFYKGPIVKAKDLDIIEI